MTDHAFFDVDKTLTPSRSLMLAEHQPIFKRLCEAVDVVAVSGAQESQIRAQIPPAFDGQYFVLAQNGNHAIDKTGAILWKKMLTEAQVEAVMTFVEAVRKELDLVVKDDNDLIENRGSQISYSLIGHHEDLEKKYAFDPDASLRLGILSRHAESVEKLKKNDIEVKTGGTTTFDFFPWGKNKGFNVRRLMQQYGWNTDDCIYIGDALFPGGNDETVVGIIPTHAIQDHNETFDFIARELLH